MTLNVSHPALHAPLMLAHIGAPDRDQQPADPLHRGEFHPGFPRGFDRIDAIRNHVRTGRQVVHSDLSCQFIPQGADGEPRFLGEQGLFDGVDAQVHRVQPAR